MKIKTTMAAVFVASSLSVLSVSAAEIRIDGFPDFDSHLNKILPDFQEKTGHQVSQLMNNHGDHHNKIATNLATGRGAGDVVVVDVGFVGSFVDQGGFIDLTDKFAPMVEHYAEYAVAQGKGSDGKQYAIPVDLGPGVMYYRRDFMEDFGYSVEEVMQSWETYVEYGRELKDKHNILLIGNAAALADAYIKFNVEPGNGLYFDAEGNSLVTSDRFINAFKLAKTVRDEGLDGKIDEWTEDWYTGFREGRFATQMAGAWLLGHLQNWMAPDTHGNWGVSHLPGGIYGSWGGSFLGIPKQSSNPDAAWDLIEYMISEQTQMAGFENIAAFPAHTGTYDHAIFEQPIDFLRGQQARLMFAEIANNVTPVMPHRGDLIAQSLVIQTALEQVLNDGVEIERALQMAEAQIRRRVR